MVQYSLAITVAEYSVVPSYTWTIKMKSFTSVPWLIGELLLARVADIPNSGRSGGRSMSDKVRSVAYLLRRS